MGIIEIAQSKHRFFEYVSQLTSAQDQIEVYVFDQNTGDLVYPYDPDEISELGESYIQSYYDIFQDVPALENVSVSNPENQNRYILMHDQLDTYGWEVVVVQPEIFVTTPFYKEVIKFLCIFLGILLFLTFAYGRMAKQILKPLNILKSNVERVNMDSILSDNNFLIPNKRIKTQEVATLNCAFEKMYTDLRNSAANMLLMKQRENEANYRALHALADPHFIFNSLATISVMAEENRNEDLIKMTNNLCQILRYSTSRQKGNVTIREEVFIVNKYLECIKIRYGKDLEYNINIPDSIMNISIPKLSIQMLVENCIKHGFEVEPPFQVSVLGRVADGKWMLEISDNGIGFSAEVLESFQKKFNAMESDVDMEDLGIGGSGLTNIFTRLKLMDKDSYFNIENRPEGGCRIQFGNVIKGQKKVTYKYSVMVVEDEEMIGNNIEKKINNLGNVFYVRKVCKNGRDALSEMEKAPVDIVITDIRMPVMDGIQLIRQLKEKYNTVKIVVLSGYSDFEYTKEALINHVEDYLLKPVVKEELQKTMERLQPILDADRREFTGDCTRLSPEQMTEKVIDYILKNYKNDVTILEIAKKMGYSSEHLSRVFKKQTGQSIIKYIATVRINEAKKLLLSTPNIEIGLIGQMVGYSDALYFSRVFQKNTGMYPSEFRKSLDDCYND